MITRKKSRFLTFCCSLLPGAGEMYLGFMKMGISLMGMFFGLMAITQLLNVSAFIYIAVIVWFYSFFHVHNLAGLSDMDFANTQDEYLFSIDTFFKMDRKSVRKYRKVIAGILMILGVVLLWNGIMDICYSYLPRPIFIALSHIGYTVPQIVVGAGIILGGFYMIKGKKEELSEVIIDAGEEEIVRENGNGETSEGSSYGTETDNKNT